PDNTSFVGTVTVDAPERLTARFAAGAVPPGTYSVRARRPGGAAARREDAGTVVAGGQARLGARPGLPPLVGPAPITDPYAEYANTGDVAMPAPLLVVHASQKGMMTLDPVHLVPPGFVTDEPRAGFSDSVQILASGSTPGLLQPGEVVRVPVYWTGQQLPI